MKPIRYTPLPAFYLVLFFVLNGFPAILEAQDVKLPFHRAYRSQQHLRELQLQDSMLRRIYRNIASQEASQRTRLNANSENWQELTVPLVFHVLYTNEADRVSEQQILEQIEILNEDFAAAALPTEDVRDPDGSFRQLATDSRIRFCRAAADPLGMPTTAVQYRKTTLATFTGPAAEEIKRGAFGSAPWNPQRYLNVWVVAQEDNVAGYAQPPGARGATDGIVIDPKYFGVGGTAIAPFNGGKTLTHLIGSYLGLSELWSEDGCGDDGVSDTPVHNLPNFGVPGGGHISTCDGDPIEMTMNFMDNTDDAVQYMFTRGQAARMRSVLLTGGLRATLTVTPTECSSDNLSVIPFSLAPTANTTLSNPPSTNFVGLAIAPNPASSQVTVTVSFGAEATDGRLIVFDAKGSKVYDTLITRSNDGSSLPTNINVANWISGAYMVTINLNGQQISQRLIVR